LGIWRLLNVPGKNIEAIRNLLAHLAQPLLFIKGEYERAGQGSDMSQGYTAKLLQNKGGYACFLEFY
jgi:hypothetical protein